MSNAQRRARWESITTWMIRQLPGIATVLNNHHGVDYSTEYWGTALAMPLTIAAHAMADHQDMARELVAAYGDLPLHVTLTSRNTYSFQGQRELVTQGLWHPRYADWLHSLVLERIAPSAWELHHSAGQHQHFKITHSGLDSPAPPTLYKRLRMRLGRLLDELPCPRLEGFGKWHGVVLSLAVLLNPRRRKQSLPLSSLDSGTEHDWDFDAASVLKTLVPRDYFDISPARPGKILPNKIMSTDFHDVGYITKVAARHVAGQRLIGIQHGGGGNYGAGANGAAAPMTEYRMDAFLTWGWREFSGWKSRFLPTPHPLTSRYHRRHQEKDPRLIFVGTSMQPVPSLTYGETLTWWSDYRQAKVRFFHGLPKSVLANCTYRPYPIGYIEGTSLQEVPYLRRHLPDLQFFEKDVGTPLHHVMLRSRLMVMDNHATSVAIALGMNLPLVLYWDPAANPLCGKAQRLLDGFAAAGIWHATPESAARHVAKIWDDVPGWWNSEPVRAACAAWQDEYARSDRRWLWKMFRTLLTA